MNTSHLQQYRHPHTLISSLGLRGAHSSQVELFWRSTIEVPPDALDSEVNEEWPFESEIEDFLFHGQEQILFGEPFALNEINVDKKSVVKKVKKSNTSVMRLA